MKSRFNSRRGVTLLETMVFVSLWAIVAVGTMTAVAQSSVIRSRAADRSAMVMIAQQELERVRHLPAGDLKEGTEERTLPEWPAGTVAEIETREREDGTWLIDVRVNRSTIEGLAPVRLTTLRLGGET